MALKGDRYNFYHPIHASYYLHIPQLLDKIILDSKYGWLLMAGIGDDVSSIFFFHPLKNEKIDLPDLPWDGLFFQFGFCSSPTSSECVVVAITSGYTMVTIGITKPGEENWTQVEIRFRPKHQGDKLFRQGNDTFHISCTPVFHDGNCYCLDVDGKVIVFDPKDIAGSLNFCGKSYSEVPHKSVVQSFIVESDGELLTVFLHEEGRIWICKLNPTKGEWMKVEDLGNKVMYVSNGGSWAEKATFQGMGNKIYLPMLYDNNVVVFYCLATGRFHSNGCDFSQKNFYHMKQLYHSTWIKLW